ncbi:MAG: GNAT family N-acetyltransferase [Mycobacterium leprae]
MNIFEGKKVRLRGMEPTDWQEFYKWNQDTEMARYSYEIPFPQSQDAVRKHTAATAETRIAVNDEFRFVIETLGGEFAGQINTHSCDRKNGTFQYGVAIVPRFQRQGFAAEAVRLVLNYFFGELRYQKVSARVYSFNGPSIRLHESLGFKLEGRLRRMIYTGGEYYDELVYGLTAEEFADRQ